MSDSHKKGSESRGDSSPSSDASGPARRDFMKGTAAAFAVAGTGLVPMQAAASEDGGWEAETIRADDGIVAASQPVAAEVGAEVLDAGGNAFDAAAAVQLALTVVDPYGSGLGGSGMMVGYSAADERTYTLNSQVRAPIDASVDIRYDEDGNLKPSNDRRFGGIAVGTPGTLRGLDVMVKNWGTMDLSELAGRPAEIAEDGFEVDERLASVVAGVAWRFNDAAEEIWGTDGDPVQAGETVVQEDLGRTLRLIEDDGIRPFYRGEIAEAIVETVRDAGGVMRMADLQSYRPTLDRPTQIRYDNPHPTIANNEPIDVVSAPAPIEGGYIVPGMLKLLDELDVSDVDSLSAERFNLTWQARAAMENPVITTAADPEFVDVPSSGILDDDFLDTRRDLMTPGERNPDLLDEESDPWAYQAGEPWTTDPPVGIDDEDVPDEHEPPEQDTTHFTVADGDGNVVSFTGTLSSGFGTGAIVPEYGFFLNNSVAQLANSGPTQIGPLRRYTTTVAPTLVLRGGKPLFTCGSPGGIVISQAVADVLVNVLEYGMTLKEAVEHPRMYVFTGQWEPGTPEETIDGLEDLGYEMNASPGGGVGDTQMIAVDQERGELVGVYDPRRGGGVSGVGTDRKRAPRR
ncbi:gamma-glutamyltransferase [Natrononativus amylolyticus]|uniref:gamma-glutamyltransferase n=1 Tax=Natrononativus amylolyticus TaxID=2963434 RepID=UPI0020CC70AD|nr:gamma-glutamyltransferase [Natrononativus amylolyticus]